MRRTDVPPQSLPIGPEDYFVLSRVDAPTSVAELCAASGLPSDQAHAIVEHLVEVGALALVADGSAPAPPRSPTPTHGAADLRARADARRRALLQQGLGSKPAGASPRDEPPRDEPANAREPAEAREPAIADEQPSAPLVAWASADDPRIDPSCAVPVDHQRRVLGMIDRYDELSPFDVLGLAPTDDERAIKRAYFEASRTLHPDAYFGKKIDSFGPMLTRLFARAKQAYGQLRDPQIRRPYVEASQAHARERDAVRKAEEQQRLEEAAALRRAAQEHERREHALRLEAQARIQEQRLRDKLERQANEHLLAADEARQQGNLAREANFLRLALQADPNSTEIRDRWHVARAASRKERAKIAFARGMQFSEYGQLTEAVPLLCEAADSDPTPEHLAHAAEALGGGDPIRAREYALRALESLVATMHADASAYSASDAAALRLVIARAFMAAGQTKTALEQVQLARAARPHDPQVRALLNSLKVT